MASTASMRCALHTVSMESRSTSRGNQGIFDSFSAHGNAVAYCDGSGDLGHGLLFSKDFCGSYGEIVQTWRGKE